MNHLIMNLLQIVNKNCDRMKDEIANTMKANKASNSFMGWPEDTNPKPVMWSSREAAVETIQAVFQSKYTNRDIADFIDGLKALGLLDWKAENEIEPTITPSPRPVNREYIKRDLTLYGEDLVTAKTEQDYEDAMRGICYCIEEWGKPVHLQNVEYGPYWMPRVAVALKQDDKYTVKIEGKLVKFKYL